ncbi:hypothetical protein ASG87_15850 [Frateuria sp. Soil773]|uniref:MarR family winged helix-turn-helix transcriptional regulator n=1 Tax=Frateuria sp. Soil773 TaxID=1736407 RepID=UPI0006FF62D8|nr:MarR family transcriptional regulator [Frateuria sp. Soil773]KRE96794.1 hypothetical protein ASG87_15850 [Frateuria sp. Soil773]
MLHAVHPDEPGLAVADDLLLAFQQLIPALVLLNERAAGTLGLLSVDMQVLHILTLNGEAPTPKELAARTELAPSTLARVLARLEERGLVRRVQNPRDGRSVKIAPTPRMNRIRDHFAPYAKAVTALTRSFAPAEQAAIRRFLRDLLKITH